MIWVVQELSLHACGVVELSDYVLAALTGLTHLDLSHNYLLGLPDTVTQVRGGAPMWVTLSVVAAW